MPGVRIYHHDPSFRHCTITIEHPYRILSKPHLCPTCNVRHKRKTYHLNLDGEASTVVSPTVFEALKQCGLPNLAVESEVAKPPGSTIDFNQPLGSPQTIVREKPRIRLTNVGV